MPTWGHDFSRVPKQVAKQESIECESDSEEQPNAVEPRQIFYLSRS
jgi:hypothetical protein